VYERLLTHARKRGLQLALSVYDFAGLRFAVDQGAALIKIASSNIVHRPLIEQAATSGVPVVMDTGGASMDETARAATWFRSAGGTQLILEYSPPAPPAPPGRHNLRMIAMLRDTFGCPAGLSDHHHGAEMLFAAAALGADVLEKGVFPDDVVRDQDVAHGLAISELADVLDRIHKVHDALHGPMPLEPGSGAGHPARMGLIAARDLPAGHVLSHDDVTFAFPAIGMPVEQIEQAVGRRLMTSIPHGTPLLAGHLEL
jgi:sialic acid synthase SpsE